MVSVVTQQAVLVHILIVVVMEELAGMMMQDEEALVDPLLVPAGEVLLQEVYSHSLVQVNQVVLYFNYIQVLAVG